MGGVKIKTETQVLKEDGSADFSESAKYSILGKPTSLKGTKDFKFAVTRGMKSIKGLEYAKNLKKLKLNENEISDISPLKNLTKLDLIPRDFATHIINYKLEESYLDADAGILIYTKNNNDSMSLVLKDVPKSACYYYSNGLKDNKYLSKIIINKTPVNLRLPEKAACHNSMNVIELLL